MHRNPSQTCTTGGSRFTSLAAAVFLTLLALSLIAPHRAHADDRTCGLIEQRLGWMKDVAAYKWYRQIPIEDQPREALVLEKAESRAAIEGITRQSARELFTLQMEAAKEIQHYWHSRWHEGLDQPPPPKDLQEEIRPAILKLGDQIIVSLAENRDARTPVETGSLRVEGLSVKTRLNLIETLDNIAFYPDLLTRIRDTGIIRVGTTGDYPPFSLEDPSGRFSGVDIERATDFASFLGAKPEFVKTSWPTLVRDLTANRFDIAVGGISYTEERLKYGDFSIPYYAGGKTLICRCSDTAKFPDLAHVDRPGIRVIVNPGGTNEQFVDSQIHVAEKVLHEDNRSIFQALIQHKADVMITDQVEARWQAFSNPTLCIPLEAPLTTQLKAYYLQKDAALKAQIDIWLTEKMATGLFSEGDFDPR